MSDLMRYEESLLIHDTFCVAANGVRPNTCPDPLWEKYYKIPSPSERVRMRYWKPFQSPALGLLHEMGHAYQELIGMPIEEMKGWGDVNYGNAFE